MKKTLLFQFLIVCFGLLLISCEPEETEQVATPTASSTAGMVDIGTEVVLSCATDGATIHYTLDGSTPTSNSEKYTTPIVISKTVTIKAIAIKEGMDNSEVLTVEYSIADITQTINGVTFTMKVVSGGTFTMGCTGEQGSDCYDYESPSHQVTLSSYYMGESEVTQALWQAVMGVNPSYFQSSTNSVYADRGNYPVEKVSWEEIVGTDGSAVGYTINGVTYYQNGFCYKLSQLLGGGKQFRLPTEAEWEYAARGGNKAASQTKYSGSANIDDVAWYFGSIPSQSVGTSGYGTQSVKTKQSNVLGLYDMSGNVDEWCSDWWGNYSSEDQTNPTGAAGSGSCVLRGGSWYDNARYCRVSDRSTNSPGSRGYDLGFRLAL